jgi:ribosome modulation factor
VSAKLNCPLFGCDVSGKCCFPSDCDEAGFITRKPREQNYAWEEGFDAYEQGQGQELNPYSQTSAPDDCLAWESGWQTALEAENDL